MAGDAVRRGFGIAMAALLCLALPGCMEAENAAAPETALASAPILKREGVSLTDATVAVVSVDGAPEGARGDFAQAFAKQLGAHEIAAVESKKAHYLLRVYLAAAPAEGGANLEYVLDVYDARRARLARLSDGMGVKGSGDTWSLMSTATLENAAAKSADDLAAFLSNMPEAKPATSPALSYAE